MTVEELDPGDGEVCEMVAGGEKVEKGVWVLEFDADKGEGLELGAEVGKETELCWGEPGELEVADGEIIDIRKAGYHLPEGLCCDTL